MTAGVPRVWARAAVAVVVLLAAGVTVPAAPALNLNTEIAFQANTGYLWTWSVEGSSADTGDGMAAGTNPSVAASAGLVLANHEIAFQANTGDLWTTGAYGRGDTGLGMMAGTSPSIGFSQILFQANTQVLWSIGISSSFAGTTGQGMAPDSSPALVTTGLAANAQVGARLVWEDYNRDVWALTVTYPAVNLGAGIVAGTSPAASADYVAWQGTGGDLYVDNGSGATDTDVQMMPGTSPSINDSNVLAVQASSGDLSIYNIFAASVSDTGVKMMPGTSPSIDDNGDVAFQGSNGDLWLWVAPATGVDLRLGMRAGTSPSISLDPGSLPLVGARPAALKIGGPGSDRLVGGSGNDLIAGGPGNDLIRGGAGNDVLDGGPGNDRIYGGPGNDVIYGGPGNDRINPGPGRDRVFAGPGNDRIFARDGERDVIDCGPGHDVAIVDRVDVTRHCEVVIRPRRRLQQPRTGLG